MKEIKRNKKTGPDQDGGERIDEVKNNPEGKNQGELGRSDKRRKREWKGESE